MPAGRLDRRWRFIRRCARGSGAPRRRIDHPLGCGHGIAQRQTADRRLLAGSRAFEPALAPGIEAQVDPLVLRPGCFGHCDVSRVNGNKHRRQNGMRCKRAGDRAHDRQEAMTLRRALRARAVAAMAALQSSKERQLRSAWPRSWRAACRRRSVRDSSQPEIDRAGAASDPHHGRSGVTESGAAGGNGRVGGKGPCRLRTSSRRLSPVPERKDGWQRTKRAGPCPENGRRRSGGRSGTGAHRRRPGGRGARCRRHAADRDLFFRVTRPEASGNMAVAESAIGKPGAAGMTDRRAPAARAMPGNRGSSPGGGAADRNRS